MIVKKENGIYKLHEARTTCGVPFFNNTRVGIVFERSDGTKKMFGNKYGRSIYIESQTFIWHYKSGISKADKKRYKNYLDYLTDKLGELNN